MRREAAACFDGSGEVVVAFSYFVRSVLEYARRNANQFGRIGCNEGGGCASEVVQTHGFAELGPGVGADNVEDAATAKWTPLAGCPKPVMLPATEEARADLVEVAKQIGEEFLGNTKTLGTLSLGVLWEE